MKGSSLPRLSRRRPEGQGCSSVSVRSTHLECELRSGHRPHDWRIVETMEQISNEGRPRRREYSKDFKAEVLAKCRQPGASVGGVALAHGLHSNMVHRWIREAGAAYRAPLGMPGSQIAQAMQPRFTPVPLDLLSPAVPQAPAGSADQTAPYPGSALGRQVSSRCCDLERGVCALQFVNVPMGTATGTGHDHCHERSGGSAEHGRGHAPTGAGPDGPAAAAVCRAAPQAGAARQAQAQRP